MGILGITTTTRRKKNNEKPAGFKIKWKGKLYYPNDTDPQRLIDYKGKDNALAKEDLKELNIENYRFDNDPDGLKKLNILAPVNKPLP
jgi:hypothetical protein